MGRPSEFTQDVADAICSKLSDGLSLREICRADDMPDKSTVMRWLAKDAQFRDQYAQAREAQADYWADEILEIADDASNDWMERKNDDGEVTGEIVNHDHIARSRLRVDSRKWLLSKLAPKKYGDKVTQEMSGPGGGPIETVTQIRRIIVKPGHSDGGSVPAAPGAGEV